MDVDGLKLGLMLGPSKVYTTLSTAHAKYFNEQASSEILRWKEIDHQNIFMNQKFTYNLNTLKLLNCDIDEHQLPKLLQKGQLQRNGLCYPKLTND